MSAMLWTGRTALLLSLMLIVGCSPAASPVSDSIGNVEGRKVVTTPSSLSTTNGDNFRISFVPLFSLIGSFFPKLLRRLSDFAKPQNGRSISTSSDEADFLRMDGHYCSLEQMGSWRDPGDCRKYYVCESVLSQSLDCSTSGYVTDSRVNTTTSTRLQNMQGGCVAMSLFRCPAAQAYSDATRQCEIQTTPCVALSKQL